MKRCLAEYLDRRREQKVNGKGVKILVLCMQNIIDRRTISTENGVFLRQNDPLYGESLIGNGEKMQKME